MALPPLNKNTGRMGGAWQLGRLFVSAKLAEDPGLPLPLRTWSTQNADGTTQRDMLIDIARVTHAGPSGQHQQALNIIVGPLSLWVALL